MSRLVWSLHAYQLIEPDEQLDLFACRQVRVHLLARQLELSGRVDTTLCGSVLPAQPLLHALQRDDLRDPRLCPDCKRALQAQKAGQRLPWGDD